MKQTAVTDLNSDTVDPLAFFIGSQLNLFFNFSANINLLVIQTATVYHRIHEYMQTGLAC